MQTIATPDTVMTSTARRPSRGSSDGHPQGDPFRSGDGA